MEKTAVGNPELNPQAPEKNSDDVNDYSSVPREVQITYRGLGATLGSMTGEEEHSMVAGGWQGTDDATSTAPSDFEDMPRQEGEMEEDPTGRAYGGGLNSEDGGVVDLTGKPVGESRDWEAEPIVTGER